MFRFFADLFLSRRSVNIYTEEGLKTPAYCPEYYFADGNVVLVAEGTGFRVHSGILCRHSKVFNDLINPSHPRDSQETIWGCPYVTLDDSFGDLLVILGLLYDGGVKFLEESLPIKYVLAMLRLGFKYEIEYIWSEAIRRLTLCFPLSFEKFHSAVISDVPRLVSPIQMAPLDVIDIVRVYRELKFDSRIPPVYYWLAQLRPSDVLAACRVKRLSFKELSYYHDTVETLRTLNVEAFSPILTSKVPRHCTQPSQCLRAYANISEHIIQNGFLNSTGIIRDLDALKADIGPELELCERCLQSFRSHQQDICQRMWDELGECCGVPCWTKAVKKTA